MKPISVFSCLALLAAQACATALVDGVDIFVTSDKIYDVFIPAWEVQVFPNGEFVPFNGTIETIHAELLKLNPKWNIHFLGAEAADSTAMESHISKRAHFEKEPICGGRWEETGVDHIEEGIRYLRRVKGKPTNRGGPGACGRVSCSWKSAIWWCNDRKSAQTLSGFGDIADGAQAIKDKCRHGLPGHPIYDVVSGQVFHRDDWNVIVRRDGHHC